MFCFILEEILSQSVDEFISPEGISGMEMLIYFEGKKQKQNQTRQYLKKTSRDGHICYIYDLVILTPLKNVSSAQTEGFSLTLSVAVSGKKGWAICFMWIMLNKLKLSI